jgi:signal transduction histidine kinase
MLASVAAEAGPVSPLSLVLATGGAAMLGLGWYVWRTWNGQSASGDDLGLTSVSAFIALVVGGAVWALTAAIALETDATGARLFLAVLLLSIPAFVGVLWLLFALVYSGRGELLSRRVVLGLFVIPATNFALLATNHLHGLSLRRIEPATVLGVSAVDFRVGPAFVLGIGYVWVLIWTTIAIFGREAVTGRRLHTRQAAALGIAVLAPLLFNVPTAMGVNPVAPLDLTPFGLVLMAGSLWCVVGRGRLFRTGRAVRNLAAERTIEQLGDPVLVLDRGERIVRANAAAAPLLGCSPSEAVGRALGDVFAGDPGEVPGSGTAEFRDDGRGETYDVQVTPVTNDLGEQVGRTAVFRNVTERRNRRQRLEVLNRVLRHNLRNDMNVVLGRLELVEERLEAEELREHVAIARETSAELVELGEKARELGTLVDADTPAEACSVPALVDRIAEHARESHRTATIRTVGPAVSIRTRPALLSVVIENLVENAIVHTAARTVRVSVEPTTSGVEIVVADDGPGIPEEETRVLDGGRIPAGARQRARALARQLGDGGTRRGTDLRVDRRRGARPRRRARLGATGCPWPRWHRNRRRHRAGLTLPGA